MKFLAPSQSNYTDVSSILMCSFVLSLQFCTFLISGLFHRRTSIKYAPMVLQGTRTIISIMRSGLQMISHLLTTLIATFLHGFNFGTMYLNQHTDRLSAQRSSSSTSSNFLPLYLGFTSYELVQLPNIIFYDSFNLAGCWVSVSSDHAVRKRIQHYAPKRFTDVVPFSALFEGEVTCFQKRTPLSFRAWFKSCWWLRFQILNGFSSLSASVTLGTSNVLPFLPTSLSAHHRACSIRSQHSSLSFQLSLLAPLLFCLARPA